MKSKRVAHEQEDRIPCLDREKKKRKNPKFCKQNDASQQYIKSNFFILDSVSIPLDPTAKWLKINCNQTGFYRVNYDKENWDALAKQLIAKNTRSHMLQWLHKTFKRVRSANERIIK